MNPIDPVTRLATRIVPTGLPVVRDALERALEGFLGEVLDTSADPGDPGLFGPGSATWALLREPVVLPMAFRALLVQALHPVALTAVVDHGSFDHDFMPRIRRTAAYLQAANFGSVDQALGVSALTQRIHRRVVGVTRQGEPYAAGDTHLLAWVGMTFTESTLALHEAFGHVPVDPVVADRFVAEQAVLNALLDPAVDPLAIGADPDARAALVAGGVTLPMIADGTLPTDVAGLTARLEAFTPELELRGLGRSSMAYLFAPNGLSAAERAVWTVLATATVSTLPPRWRAITGQPVSPLRDTLAREAIRAALAGFRVAHGPLSPYTAGMERSARRPAPSAMAVV